MGCHPNERRFAIGRDTGVSGVRPSREFMRAMVVEVGPEIEHLVFEICRRPEQQVIQILSAKGAD